MQIHVCVSPERVTTQRREGRGEKTRVEAGTRKATKIQQSDGLINVTASVFTTEADEVMSCFFVWRTSQRELGQRIIACRRHIIFGDTHTIRPWRSRQQQALL